MKCCSVIAHWKLASACWAALLVARDDARACVLSSGPASSVSWAAFVGAVAPLCYRQQNGVRPEILAFVFHPSQGDQPKSQNNGDHKQ